MVTRMQKLKEAGQSLWLDNIQRRELLNGTIQRFIHEDGVCGVTSNPTIFMNAITQSQDYDDQIARLVQQGKDAATIYHQITIDDIKNAGKLFMPIFEETKGKDGFISIELNPQYAFSIEESIKEAREISSEIGLPNIMIKVPGTQEGMFVVRQLITEGLNVNITLLFSPEQYKQVVQAYMEGLEERARQGQALSDVRSVASFFISRIETKVDRRIDAVAQVDEGLKKKVLEFRGQAAIQVAKVTYSLFKELFSSSRFKILQEKGAHPQRLLWASTGTKDPSYSDVKYAEGLIAPNTINTLPPKTIAAFRDHGIVKPTIEEGLQEAFGILQKIEQAGIDLGKIYDELLAEGVKAFETSYLELLKAIEEKGKLL